MATPPRPSVGAPPLQQQQQRLQRDTESMDSHTSLMTLFDFTDMSQDFNFATSPGDPIAGRRGEEEATPGEVGEADAHDSNGLKRKPKTEATAAEEEQEEQEEQEGDTTVRHEIDADVHVEARFVDITDLLCLPQSKAAAKLCVPVSTLSKRWKDAARDGRKWPYRKVKKIEKEIARLSQILAAAGVPEAARSGPLDAGEASGAEGANDRMSEVQRMLSMLWRQRREELRPVVIRL